MWPPLPYIWTLYFRGNEQENVGTVPVICTRVYRPGTFESLIKVRPAAAAECSTHLPNDKQSASLKFHLVFFCCCLMTPLQSIER